MPPDDALDPGRLESLTFQIVRRGFDPSSVRAELQRAAGEIRRARLERDDLIGRLAEFDDIEADQLEAHRVASALGVEATQVLEAAHLAATERAERAEREAAAVLDEAITAADAVRADAQTNRDEQIAAAQLEAETIVEEGRTRGREMVNEASTVRERMLRDLARKRQTGRSQVEQLRAGRDRLLDALSTVQESLDTAMTDLVNSVPEARSAAERAGLRIAAETVPTPEDLEDEIEAARLVGHPLVENIVDPGPGDSDPFPTGEMDSLAHLDVLDAPEASDDAAELDAAGPDDAESDDTASDEVEVEEVEAASEQDEPVELYDVEAEESAPEPEADDDNDDDDLFARLRSSRAEAVAAAETVLENADEPEPEADEPEPDPEPEAEPEPEESDERTAAKTAATAAAAKAMKKILVEEQGTLLDGIRRSGAAALSYVTDDGTAHRKTYEKAATPAMRELVNVLGGPKRARLGPALAHIDAIALAPLRQRLEEIGDRLDDEAELSDTVSALYRESRSRLLDEAASAVASAVDGSVVVAGASGQVRWVTEADGPCGPDCADNALAGSIAAGAEFPTGDRYPPAHPTCTCRLESVTKSG